MPRRKKGTSSGLESAKSGSGGGSINKGKPQQRNAANARERARMRVLSKAFCRLKTTLPWVPADTKLSKLDTLRLAGSYIDHLKKILDNDNFQNCDDPSNNSHPALNLTWPFGFNRPSNIFEGSGSVGGGSDAEESSSGCWEPESPTKDCIHLDNLTTTQSDLLGSNKMQFQEARYKCHTPSTPPSCNNNNLPYNFNQNQHQHQHSNIPYYQSDVILSMS